MKENSCAHIAKTLLLLIGIFMASLLAQPGNEKETSLQIEVLQTEMKQLKENNQSLRTIIESQLPTASTVVEKSSNTPSLPLDINFYGFIQLDSYYNSSILVDQDTPSWVASDSPGNNGEFGFNGKQTRIGAKMGGATIAGGKISSHIAMDFYGQNGINQFSRQHEYIPRAYVAYFDWKFEDWAVRAGLDWANYLITYPDTVNFGYFNLHGQLGLRMTQLTFRKNHDLGEYSNLNASLSISDPVGGLFGSDSDGDSQDDGMDAGIPMFDAKITYQTSLWTTKQALIGLAALYGQEDLDIGPPKRYDMWGFIGGYELPITESLVLKGTAWKGINLDSAWGGIAQGINTTLRTEIEASGGWIQLGYQATDKLSFYTGYGIDDPKDGDLNAGQRTKNKAFMLNTFYAFSPKLKIGAEWLNMHTGYKGTTKMDADRFQSSIKYSF